MDDMLDGLRTIVNESAMSEDGRTATLAGMDTIEEQMLEALEIFKSEGRHEDAKLYIYRCKEVLVSWLKSIWNWCMEQIEFICVTTLEIMLNAYDFFFGVRV